MKYLLIIPLLYVAYKTAIFLCWSYFVGTKFVIMFINRELKRRGLGYVEARYDYDRRDVAYCIRYAEMSPEDASRVKAFVEDALSSSQIVRDEVTAAR